MQTGSGSDQPAAAATVDLTNCDREPIHTPGSIQPHGLLFAFTEDDLHTVSVSENLVNFAGLRPAIVLGTRLDELFDPPSRARLHTALRQTGPLAAGPVPMRFARAGRASLDGLLHRHDGLAFLELEAPAEDGTDPQAFFRRTGGAIKRLQEARTLHGACAAAACEVRRITEFDRVKIYRFAGDFSGEVIAESRAEGIESFLGLHFPPSDIPAQARHLYTINPTRIIPDIRYVPVPIVPDRHPATGRPIDLSFAVLRSVSPIHLEYMRNMGIRATMSVSILRGDRLWGLIACHNRMPRHVGQDARQACEMVAQVLAWQTGVMEEEAVTRHGLKGQDDPAPADRRYRADCATIAPA